MSLKIDRLQLEIIIDNDQSRKQLRALEGEMQKLKKEMKKVPEGSKEWNDMSNRLKDLKVQHDKVIDTIGLHGLSLKELAQRQKELNLMMRNMDPRSAEYKKLGEQYKAVSQRVGELRGGMRQTGNAMGNITGGFTKFFGVIGAGLASVAGLTAGIRKLVQGTSELSDKLADVRKTTGLTATEVRELDKELLKLNTRTSRNELLDLARIAGKLGVEGKENIAGFVKAADQINVALSEDLGGDAEEAIRQVGKLVDLFGVKDQFGLEQGLMKVGSAINSLGASSTANEGYLVEFARRMGGVSTQANITVQDILGMGATLDQLGQTSEVSSTSLSKIMVDMFKDTADYAKIAGMEVGEFTTLLNTDANEAFIKMLEGLNGNNDGLSSMTTKLDDLGVDGSRAVGVLATLAKNTGLLRDQQVLANEEFEKGNSLTNEFNVKNETLGATLAKIQKRLAGAFINSNVMDGLESMAKGLEGFLKRHVGVTKSLDDQKKVVKDLDDNLIPLINRYEELKGKSNLTGTEQVELKDAIEKISEAVPSAITQVDKYGKVLGISADKAREFTEQQKRMLEIMNADEIREHEKAIESLNNQIKVMQTKIAMGGELSDFGDLIPWTPEEVSGFIAGIKDMNLSIEAHQQMLDELRGNYNQHPVFQKSGDYFEGDWTVPSQNPETTDPEELKKLLAEKQKALEDYYAAINNLEDKNYQQSLSKDEQELLAIDEKYQALYEKAEAAGQSTNELQVMHAQELADKILEIEDEKQAEIDDKKKKALEKEIQDEQKRADYIRNINQQLIDAENALSDARINAARTVADAMAGLIGQETALGKAFFVLSKALAIAQVIRDEASSKAAIMRNLFSIPPFLPPGIPNPVFAIASATAATQLAASKLNTAASIAQIVATSIPTVSQWAEGKYDVIGASDGRTYRADYVAQGKTGIYDHPTLIGGLGLVGEQGKELVVDAPTLSNIQLNAPEIIQAIHAMRVPQFAVGSYASAPPPAPPRGGETSGAQDQKTDMMLQVLTEISAKLDKETRARVSYTDFKEVEDEINDIKNAVRK